MKLHATIRNTQVERAVLVGVQRHGEEAWVERESMQELAQLVKTAGGEVVGELLQRLPMPTAPYYIGKGKVEEVRELCTQKQARSVIFDDELTPAQGRNLEKVLSRKVIDRTQLILDIFAQRAQTSEAKLQIELAQLNYLLPRLTRMWTHLSRQSGGIGTRGPGEMQLEVDRRRVQERISRLKHELEGVRRVRRVQRSARIRRHIPTVALVGYTNAGKSTLFNWLANARVHAADQLFATLDPTTRLVELANHQRFVLSDTVGFIRKLPHRLIESFKATLEEVLNADLLLHVVDLSHRHYEQQIAAVNEVLAEIGASEKTQVLVFNKADCVSASGLVNRVVVEYPGSVVISAVMRKGLEALMERIGRCLHRWRQPGRWLIPQSQGPLIAEIHAMGEVTRVDYEDSVVRIEAMLPWFLHGKLQRFCLKD